MNTERKTILFFYPSSIKEMFLEGFQKLGYNTIDFFDNLEISSPGLYDKLMNIFWRVILKRKDYHDIRKKKQLEKACEKRLDGLLSQKIDYAVFFRQDIFSEKFLKKICDKNIFTSCYIAEGMNSYVKTILDRQKYFNKIFSFNPEDIIKNKNLNFEFLTNCYFNDEKKISNQKSNKIFYIGTGLANRITALENLSKYIEKTNYVLDALAVVSLFQEERIIKTIKLQHQLLPYKENIQRVKNSFALIDMVIETHKGLSFRFFEALYYNKKLITNNQDVQKYDFYNPDNIFITDFENFDGLLEWLNKDYVELSPQVKLKYSFENWAANMLDLPSRIPMSLP